MQTSGEQGPADGPVVPAPEVVDESVRRLRVIAAGIGEVKMELGAVMTPAWHSPAGNAFRDSLNSQRETLARLVDSVDAAAVAVANYAAFMRSKASAGASGLEWMGSLGASNQGTFFGFGNGASFSASIPSSNSINMGYKQTGGR